MEDSPDAPNPPQLQQMPYPAPPSVLEPANTPVAGPSTTPVPAPSRRIYTKKTKKKTEGMMAYTAAFVPMGINIKIPAGDYLTKERNVDVARQLSLARSKQEKQAVEEEIQRLVEEGKEVPEHNPLHYTLILHPGSRNLKLGRASDFYPKEVPNCIARPANSLNGSSHDPPVPGSRAKRVAREQAEKREAKKRRAEEGTYVETNGHGEVENNGPWTDPVDENIGHLRDYLRNRLVQERLATDWKEGIRVKATNAKVRPEALPEHNDPYRIDWTEPEGKPFFVGTEALRLPESAGYKVRFPILNRSLNRRDWASSQSLLDDIWTILQQSLQTELGILPKEYPKYSCVFIIPDHGDRVYVQAMSDLLLSVMAFKEIAVHQESYCAIFSAGMSSACVVDVGAQQTSVTCVDDGLVMADTRIRLNYGGDDITSALVTLLQRSNFPYRELDLTKSQEWLMMDNLKNKICTLEEHLVANTPWDFYLLKTEGLTQKYVFRTYDENILAPLIFFDTRLIDYEEKKGNGSFRFWNTSDDEVSDEITSWYDEPTGAMKACTIHLLPPPPAPVEILSEVNGNTAPPATNGVDSTATDVKSQEVNSSKPPISTEPMHSAGVPPTNSQTSATATPVPETTLAPVAQIATIATAPASRPEAGLSAYQVVTEAAQSPLDAAIAASISLVGTENKVKSSANSILLIGGSSAMKGLGAFIADRLPPLLRQKGFPISDVSIVPPPRNLNPRFVSWKGASVMCHLESLSDMWIGRDEWEAVGQRALKDRYLFF
ncbi:hypothetical protein IAR55_000442 [Kwoniella newhampshirensis]|uniref:Actin-related protein 8 n=1 Tax=Kwoniella newhampshirensis TaxID=1651941 RepID=A0AAW0Z6L5_9TREE